MSAYGHFLAVAEGSPQSARTLADERHRDDLTAKVRVWKRRQVTGRGRRVGA